MSGSSGSSSSGPGDWYYQEQIRMQQEQLELQREQMAAQESAAAEQKKATDEQDAISKRFANQQQQYLGRVTGGGNLSGDLRARALLDDTNVPINRRSLLGVG